MVSNKEIADYYDFSKLDYQIYNLAQSNISMHFGIWDEGVKSHKEALLNENKVLAEHARITKDDYVLDIGCGYGTTAIWLAKNIGCKVVGITISEKQVEEAREAARRHKVDNLTDFRLGDFHKTEFQDNTFDVVIAIESCSHSSEKLKVLKEIYRTLKPGGRVTIADGFFNKKQSELSEKEREVARLCFDGVHVPPVAEKNEFEDWLKQAWFQNIEWYDKTPYILKISKKISNLAKLILPFSKILGVVGIKSLSTSHVLAFINQYYAWRDGFGVYGMFRATK